MPDESSPGIFQPTRQAGSKRYNMWNLSPVDNSNCALAEANIFEQAFWIGDVFVPEHYTQAVSCDESEKWKLAMDSEKSSLEQNNTLLLVNYRKEEKQFLQNGSTVYHTLSRTEILIFLRFITHLVVRRWLHHTFSRETIPPPHSSITHKS